MTDTAGTSVLKRKLAAGREDGNASGRSVLRALRLALARSAADLFDLPLAVIGAMQGRCDHDAAGGYLSDDRLLVVLDGANGLSGAVSLDRACVSALIQQQTMGRVTGTAMPERAFTGTDAALAELLIEAILERAADLADTPEDLLCFSGFRFGARVEDVRSLMLTLEAERFRVFELTVDIADGAMQGAICLMMPDAPMDEGNGAIDTAQLARTGPQLEHSFGVMRAELTAMICRIRIPLTELAGMRPGDVIPLMRERIDETELITINGQSIAAGRLGQINGLRALRLNETMAPTGRSELPVDKAFYEHVVHADPQDIAALENGGNVVPQLIDHSGAPQLPAEIKDNMVGQVSENMEDELGILLDKMTPEQAAAEISQLAGLNPEDTERGGTDIV